MLLCVMCLMTTCRRRRPSRKQKEKDACSLSFVMFRMRALFKTFSDMSQKNLTPITSISSSIMRELPVAVLL